jgi:hypothetical protein
MSNHKRGRAFDITVKGEEIKETCKRALILTGFNTLELGNSWLHLSNNGRDSIRIITINAKMMTNSFDFINRDEAFRFVDERIKKNKSGYYGARG